MKTICRTYRLTPATAAAIRAIADEHGVWSSDVAEALLAFAVAEHQAGRLMLDVQPLVYQVIGVKSASGYSEFSGFSGSASTALRHIKRR